MKTKDFRHDYFEKILSIKLNKHKLPIDCEYLNGLSKVISESDEELKNRTGINTINTSGVQMKFDVSNFKLPRLCGKYVNPRLAFTEAIWMLSGRTDLEWLNANNVKYWNNWQLEDGTVGATYGKQIRDFNGFDQLEYVVSRLINNPADRRLLISLWEPNEVLDTSRAALAPCATQIQFVPIYIDNKYVTFDLVVTMRSCDMFIGCPYDLMLFTFIGQIVSFICTFRSRRVYNLCRLTLNIGDAHIYVNHYEQVLQYMENLSEITDAINTYVYYGGWSKPIDPDTKDINILLNALFNEYKECKNIKSISDINNILEDSYFKVIKAPVAI